MNEREQLEAKGYRVGTRDLAIEWLCTLEIDNHVDSFFGATEAEAVHHASRHVAQIEQGYEQQQRRLRCEGCGE